MTTLDMVSAAADELLASGQKASVRAVRRRLGGGSPNVLSAHLRTWRVARQMVPAAETPASIVAEVAGVAPIVWGAALEAARKQVRAELDRAALQVRESDEDVDELQGLLEEANVHLNQVRADRQQIVDQARIDREATLEEIGHLQRALAQREADVQAQAALLKNAHTTITLQQEQLTAVTSRIGLVQQERDLERQHHRREMSQRDERLNLATTELADLRRQHLAAVDIATRSNEELVGLRRDLMSLRTHQEELCKEQQRALEVAQGQAAVLARTNGEQLAHNRALDASLRSAQSDHQSAALRVRELEATDAARQGQDDLTAQVLQRLGAIETAIANRPPSSL